MRANLTTQVMMAWTFARLIAYYFVSIVCNTVQIVNFILSDIVLIVFNKLEVVNPVELKGTWIFLFSCVR